MAGAVHLFTDGACKGNFGNCPGGWAVLIVAADSHRTLVGGAAETTNARMEMTAAIEALAALPAGSAAVLHTDAQFVVRGITEWLPGWKRSGWRKSGRKPVENRDLWERLEALAGERSVTWKWVRGHAGHPENEQVDMLAEAEAARIAAETGWTPANRYGFRAEQLTRMPKKSGRGKAA